MHFNNLRYDAILFDFDGTLADSHKDVWDSINYAAQQVGGALPQAITANPANLALPMDRLLELMTPPVLPAKLDLFKEETVRHYRRLNPLEHTTLYPGIEPLLLELTNSGIPCCIATLKSAEAMERILRLKGWGQYFTYSLSPDSLGGIRRSKTELICELLKMLKAKNPVYIGDSATDVTAAHQNGIPCIAVTYGDGEVNELIAAKPDWTVQDADELSELLRFVEWRNQSH